jgi:hypothetical protein
VPLDDSWTMNDRVEPVWLVTNCWCLATQPVANFAWPSECSPAVGLNLLWGTHQYFLNFVFLHQSPKTVLSLWKHQTVHGHRGHFWKGQVLFCFLSQLRVCFIQFYFFIIELKGNWDISYTHSREWKINVTSKKYRARIFVEVESVIIDLIYKTCLC